jgi:hypothetical protein
MATIGAQSIDSNQPFKHHTAVITGAFGITSVIVTFAAAVPQIPVMSMNTGDMRSARNPFIRCPAPYVTK